jgi:exonuclease VII large subunit
LGIDWRERGFALLRLPDGTLLKDTGALAAGQSIAIEVKGATLDAVIEDIHRDQTEVDR